MIVIVYNENPSIIEEEKEKEKRERERINT